MVEIRASLRNLRMSDKKVRLVTNTINGLSVNEAVARLQFIPKAAAPIVLKLVKSAIANAKHNNNIEAEVLVVKKIIVNQAMAFKRFRPAAHGVAHPIRKHGCHIELTLTLKDMMPAPTKKALKIAEASLAKKAIPPTKKVKKPVARPVPKKKSSDLKVTA